MTHPGMEEKCMSELRNAVQLSNPLMEEYVARNIPYMAILETTGKCTVPCRRSWMAPTPLVMAA